MGEINSELDSKRTMCNSIDLLLLESDVDDFFRDNADDILIYEKPIEEILNEDDSTDLKESELEPYIKTLKTIYNHMLDIIEKTHEDYKLPKKFNDFMKDNPMVLNDNKDWYELVYDTIYRELQRDLQRQASLDPLLRFNPGIAIPISPVHNFSSISNAKWYGNKIKEKNVLKDEIQILKDMRTEQIKTLNNYGKISGFWSGLAVLVYSSIVGIIIPILLLPYPSNTYNDITTRKFLIGLFISGLSSLFIYLAVSMYKITKDN